MRLHSGTMPTGSPKSALCRAGAEKSAAFTGTTTASPHSITLVGQRKRKPASWSWLKRTISTRCPPSLPPRVIPSHLTQTCTHMYGMLALELQASKTLQQMLRVKVLCLLISAILAIGFINVNQEQLTGGRRSNIHKALLPGPQMQVALGSPSVLAKAWQYLFTAFFLDKRMLFMVYRLL